MPGHQAVGIPEIREVLAARETADRELGREGPLGIARHALDQALDFSLPERRIALGVIGQEQGREDRLGAQAMVPESHAERKEGRVALAFRNP
jgi:hypothetical protein